MHMYVYAPVWARTRACACVCASADVGAQSRRADVPANALAGERTSAIVRVRALIRVDSDQPVPLLPSP